MIFSLSLRAVNSITGIWLVSTEDFSIRHNSSPSNTGMTISEIMISGLISLAISKAFPPSGTPITLYSDDKLFIRYSLISLSSSARSNTFLPASSCSEKVSTAGISCVFSFRSTTIPDFIFNGNVTVNIVPLPSVLLNEISP